MSQLSPLAPVSEEHIRSASYTLYCKQLLSGGFVAPSPKQAVDRLLHTYGARPNRLGTNCPGILRFRALLRDTLASQGEHYAYAFIIVAPHTHWPPGPIIQTFDRQGDRYWVGPMRGAGPFLPISFVFSTEGPLPYEWVDQSCCIDATDLRLAWNLVTEIATALKQHPIASFPMPLGLSLHHRFKPLFAPPTLSTLEVPDEGGGGLSYITRDNSTYPLFDAEENQVGWSAQAIPELAPSDVSILEELDRQLTRLPMNQVGEVLEIMATQSVERA